VVVVGRGVVVVVDRGVVVVATGGDGRIGDRSRGGR